MKKHTELKKYKKLIDKNGIVHIVYYASDIHDIIHPLSIEENEILSEDFVGFLEKYRPLIHPKAPTVLEISGKQFSEEEQTLINNTIWSNFCMNMTHADIEARACVKSIVLYLIYTVISALLLFSVKNISDEVIVNLAYMPFWFFGYRLLIYIILDCMPLWNLRKWYRQLASTYVFFSGSKDTVFNDISEEELSKEIKEYLTETYKKLQNNRMALRYIKEKGLIELGCRVNSIEDIIMNPLAKGREYMSGVLAGYIGLAEPFFRHDCRMTLEIKGKAFSEEEKVGIRNAIKNYYGLRVASEERDMLDNRRKIYLFSVLAFISCIMVFLWGAKVDIAMHEFIVMIFWFFGDYLLEFILINNFGFKKRRKILKNCMDMEVSFNPDNAG